MKGPNLNVRERVNDAAQHAYCLLPLVALDGGDWSS